MKHRVLYSSVILLASLTLGACSSDDDNNGSTVVSGGFGSNAVYTVTQVAEAPVWQMDWSYNQERPDWQEPESGSYENWTVVFLKMDPELREFVSNDDLMAVFVGDELRGCAGPAVDMEGHKMPEAPFLLKVYGNESSDVWVDVTLKYYNSRLKHIFTLEASVKYTSDRVFGIEEDMIPYFTYGPSKYPILMNVALDSTPIVDADIVISDGDMTAAFVGNECRGVTVNNGRLTVYGRVAGEKVTLKYYEAGKRRVHTFPNALVTEQQQQLSIIIP